MDDYGHQLAEESLAKLEKELAKLYRQAERDIRAKILKKQRSEFESYMNERSMLIDSLDGTKESELAYDIWLKRQSVSASWIYGMVEDLSDAAVRTNQVATNAIADAVPGVYAENANWAAYTIDKATHLDTRFNLVDESTVRQLVMRSDPILKELTIPKLDRPKDYRWNSQRFRSAITQGILQGESIPNIVKRTGSIFGSNRAAAMRAARTATTNAENAGRVASYERAKDIGIQLKQEWVATLDGRTRSSHRMLDGEKVDIGEKFSNGLRFPGDSWGAAEEVYNCRCTLVAAVDGVDQSDAARWSRLPDGITYDEWKAGRSFSDEVIQRHVKEAS